MPLSDRPAHHRPRVLLAAAAVVVCCGGCGAASAPAPDLSTNPAASSPAPDSATPEPEAAAPQAAAPQPAGPRECKAADLDLAIVQGDGAGMSHSGVNLRFTNKSSEVCTLQGSPGVSFVTGDSGQQVGEPATRAPKSSGKQVVLRPTAAIDSQLLITNAAAYDPADCKPVQARGLRVYAPDDTASMFAPFPQQTCSAPGKVLLQVGVVGG